MWISLQTPSILPVLSTLHFSMLSALVAFILIIVIPFVFLRPQELQPFGTMRRGNAAPLHFPRRRGAPDRRTGSPRQSNEPLSHDGGLRSYEAVMGIKDVLLDQTKLPPELIDIIMDYAECWACTSSIADYTRTAEGHVTIYGSRPKEDLMLFRTKPIALPHWSARNSQLWQQEAFPENIEEGAEYSRDDLNELAGGLVTTLEHPVRKIVFEVTSHDQGMGGDPRSRGTYNHSWTWIDAGLERFDKTRSCPSDCPDRKGFSDDNEGIPTCTIRPIWPTASQVAGGTEGADGNRPRFQHELLGHQDHVIQRNKTATSAYISHHVEWSWQDDIDPESAAADELEKSGRGRGTGNGNFVRNLRPGDMLTIWGRARFPGWLNNIKQVQVKVYWAV